MTFSTTNITDSSPLPPDRKNLVPRLFTKFPKTSKMTTNHNRQDLLLPYNM